MATHSDGQLIRGIGLWQATALNMIDMIGVGPFITIPLIIAAMHGPQAMLGWVLGALLVSCDGLVWAELGATFPKPAARCAICVRCTARGSASCSPFCSSGS
jgi:amino acid transporter